MTKKKEWQVPDEVVSVFGKSNAMGMLVELYVKRPFGFRKARKCAVEQRALNYKAWEMVHELYPELREEALQHNSGVVTIIEENDYDSKKRGYACLKKVNESQLKTL